MGEGREGGSPVQSLTGVVVPHFDESVPGPADQPVRASPRLQQRHHEAAVAAQSARHREAAALLLPARVGERRGNCEQARSGQVRSG